MAWLNINFQPWLTSCQQLQKALEQAPAFQNRRIKSKPDLQPINATAAKVQHLVEVINWLNQQPIDEKIDKQRLSYCILTHESIKHKFKATSLSSNIFASHPNQIIYINQFAKARQEFAQQLNQAIFDSRKLACPISDEPCQTLLDESQYSHVLFEEELGESHSGLDSNPTDLMHEHAKYAQQLIEKMESHFSIQTWQQFKSSKQLTASSLPNTFASCLQFKKREVDKPSLAKKGQLSLNLNPSL